MSERRISGWVPVLIIGFAATMIAGYWLLLSRDDTLYFALMIVMVTMFGLVPSFVDWDLAESAKERARDRDAALRRREAAEAEGQQPGPPEEAASPNLTS